jgi:hypothetical protein
LCLVFWSLLLRRGKFKAFRWFDYPILMGILVTLVYFHPLVVFPFLFIAMYFVIQMFDKKNEFKNNKYPLSISVVLTAVMGYFIINFLNTKYTPNFYDPDAKGRLVLDSTLTDFLLKIGEVPACKDLKDNLWTDFALLPLTLMAITILYLQRKTILKILFVWASIIGYVLMILVAYRHGGSWFHVESQYLPMSIFVIIPLVCELIPAISMANFGLKTPNINQNKVLAFIICLMILFRLTDIFQTHFFYEKRVNYIGEMLEKTKKLEGTKFKIEAKNVDSKIMLQTWGFPFETLYYSALQSPDSVRTIMVYPNVQELESAPKNPNVFQNKLAPLLFKNFKQHLFHQADTIRPYVLLEDKDVK